MLEGESERSVRRVALHVLKSLSRSLSRWLSLSFCLSHARAMCGRHVTCRCRKHRSERGRRAVEGEREREGKGREGLEEERERYEESGGRGNSEDYRTNKH